jgi:hypothetical protein
MSTIHLLLVGLFATTALPAITAPAATTTTSTNSITQDLQYLMFYGCDPTTQNGVANVCISDAPALLVEAHSKVSFSATFFCWALDDDHLAAVL